MQKASNVLKDGQWTFRRTTDLQAKDVVCAANSAVQLINYEELHIMGTQTPVYNITRVGGIEKEEAQSPSAICD